MDANQETSLKDLWKKTFYNKKKVLEFSDESWQRVFKWIPSFVANLKSFENVADANGEIVAFATVTNLEVIKENDKSF